MRLPTLSLALTCAIAPATYAWHDEGHYYSAMAAVEALPDDVPAFFRDGAAVVAHGSIDPDVAKHRAAPQLRETEEPEHYLDLEMLQGRPLPQTRNQYRALCAELGVDPKDAGMLPYAITEWAQRLTLAFAEHRRWPENPYVQIKCLVYAGMLAHYAADMAMPLHTTVHWDGRADAEGESPRSGIHHKVDALPTKLPYVQIFAEPLPEPRAHEDIFVFVLDQLAANHALVDRVYELEPRLPEVGDPDLTETEAIDFTIGRTRAAAQLTAELILSAWVNSADIDMHWWLDRNTFDRDFDPTRVPEQPSPPQR